MEKYGEYSIRLKWLEKKLKHVFFMLWYREVDYYPNFLIMINSFVALVSNKGFFDTVT